MSFSASSQICVTKMSTRSCQGSDSVIKPLDTIPEDKKVRVQRTQSGFDPFEKPASQVKRVHSENNACITSKSSSSGKESPKLRRHSSPSSVSVFSSINDVLLVLIRVYYGMSDFMPNLTLLADRDCPWYGSFITFIWGLKCVLIVDVVLELH